MKKRSKKWSWRDPLYKIKFYLFVGPWSEFVSYTNELTQDISITADHEARGFTLWFRDERTQGSVVFYVGPMWNARAPDCWNTLSHEALHGVFAVMNSRGLKLHDKSDEAFTYYLGWLVEEMTKRLMK